MNYSTVYESDGSWHRHYNIYDYLGNVRVIMKEDKSILSTYTYDPFGAVCNSDSPNRLKFICKETDHESSLGDFGSSKYDTELGRFTSVDPLWESSVAMSPYAYCGNNPISGTDRSGKKIQIMDYPDYGWGSIDGEINYSSSEKAWNDWCLGQAIITATKNLVNDLRSKTGLDLYITPNGVLKYKKDENGNPIVLHPGSITARALLIDAIDADKTINVYMIFSQNPLTCSVTNSGQYNPNSILLNNSLIKECIDGASNGLNATAMGWAMQFLHELCHLYPIFSNIGTEMLPDNIVIPFINTIAAELGSDYGQRQLCGQDGNCSYDIGINAYVPFERTAGGLLERNSIPQTFGFYFVYYPKH
jgi:RHS repeat-associated protein